ncbi:hypothetical protein Tco_0892079 [Tanacetum coccineum]|uniref:Reverse transcriptase domain-containing protein n=1 Tax=Tanacetum coccineum TaxID=301880 RepID=A0ABQ5C7P2_9ASTR
MMERKIDEWSKSQNISLKQIDRTDPPPPQAHTEHVNAVFTGSEKSDDSPKIQKDSPPLIIVNNKIKKDKPIKTSKRAITWRVPFEQRNEPPAQPKVVYAPILDINYFRYFPDVLENYNLIDDEPMWVANGVVASTLGSAITIPKTTNEFTIKGNHLTLVKGNQFDDRIKTYPHKYIHEFLKICDMFKYRDTENEVVRQMMFTLSLTGEAKTFADKQSGRPSGSLPSNTQSNPKGSSSKPYQPPVLVVPGYGVLDLISVVVFSEG